MLLQSALSVAPRNRPLARRTALTDLAKAEADAILRREEVTKARQMSRFQRLVAPVDGTVQQLEVQPSAAWSSPPNR